MNDSELLQRYARQGDQDAFAELTRRYLGLVYSAARFHVGGDAGVAEDITQQVFIDLARKAPTLVRHDCLAGWLHTGVRFAAADAIRRTQRRLGREKEAGAMLSENPAKPDWTKIHPIIDDALAELAERDRQFVILRFFGQQSFATIARQFAVTENAAQKAVDRALDVLAAALAKRGVNSTAAALAVALAETGMAAPSGLMASVTAAVAAAPVGAAAGAGGSAVFMTLKLAVVVTVVGAAATVGYWAGLSRQATADAMEQHRQEIAAGAQVKRLEDRIRAESNRAAAAEADTATLLHAIDQAKDDRTKMEAVLRAAAVQSRSPAPVATVYTIQPADTFPKIARAHGISVEELAAANPDYDARRMRVGEQIKLPASR